MKVKGVVFDFDGLLFDSETPEFTAWSQVFSTYNVNLELSEWAKCVGGGNPPWRVDEHLKNLAPTVCLREATALAYEIRDNLLANQAIQEGVVELLQTLKYLKIPYAIASSSRHLWVNGFLQNFELVEQFPIIWTWDMVGAKKPDPQLYFKACESLNLSPNVCLAFEDSPNGLLAAKRAGMISVAVPNSVTQHFDLSIADHHLKSLKEVTEDFLRSIN